VPRGWSSLVDKKRRVTTSATTRGCSLTDLISNTLLCDSLYAGCQQWYWVPLKPQCDISCLQLWQQRSLYNSCWHFRFTVIQIASWIFARFWSYKLNIFELAELVKNMCNFIYFSNTSLIYSFPITFHCIPVTHSKYIFNAFCFYHGAHIYTVCTLTKMVGGYGIVDLEKNRMGKFGRRN